MFLSPQITDDMEAMKRRHLEMIQELEANFRITVGEKQVCDFRREGWRPLV